MRKILATAAVAGIMALGFAAAPAQAATTSQNHGPSISTCSSLRIIAANFKSVEVAARGSVRDNLLNRNDLWAVVEDHEAPLRLRKAARRLAGPLFKHVDNAERHGPRDGQISLNDIRAFYGWVCD